MIGVLIRGRARIKIRFSVRVRVGITFNVRIYHRSNCRQSKCRTFLKSNNDTFFYDQILQVHQKNLLCISHLQPSFQHTLSSLKYIPFFIYFLDQYIEFFVKLGNNCAAGLSKAKSFLQVKLFPRQLEYSMQLNK